MCVCVCVCVCVLEEGGGSGIPSMWEGRHKGYTEEEMISSFKSIMGIQKESVYQMDGGFFTTPFSIFLTEVSLPPPPLPSPLPFPLPPSLPFPPRDVVGTILAAREGMIF